MHRFSRKLPLTNGRSNYSPERNLSGVRRTRSRLGRTLDDEVRIDARQRLFRACQLGIQGKPYNTRL